MNARRFLNTKRPVPARMGCFRRNLIGGRKTGLLALEYMRLLALALVLAVSAPTLRAATEAVTSVSGMARLITTTTIGWSFTANQDISVTHLGVFDIDQSPTNYVGDGLLVAHDVGLWNSSGDTLLAVVNVPSGTAAPLDSSGFRYMPLNTPVVLTGGETYIIGASNSETLPYDDWAYAAAATFSTDITYIEPRWNDFSSGILAAPLEAAAADNEDGYLGPSFKYDVVPEPSAVLLLGIGLTGMVGFRRTRGRTRMPRM